MTDKIFSVGITRPAGNAAIGVGVSILQGPPGPPGPVGPPADITRFITSTVPNIKITPSQTAPVAPNVGDFWLVIP